MKDRTKLIAGLVVLLGTVALGFWQWTNMQAHSLQANMLSSEAAELRIEKENLINEYQDIKVEVNTARESAAQGLSLVFPTNEDLTNLTRLFDDFAVKNNFSSNPFFISNLSYKSSEDIDGYRSLPLTMNLESSSKNLSKFLEFIESSGSLEGEVRLMEVTDMDLSYPDEYGGTYSVRLGINAYYSREL